MAEISFGGLASGLPTEDIVKGLMAVERRPLERLEKQKSYEGERLRAYGEFKSKLEALRSAVSSLNLTSSVRTTRALTAAGAPFTATSSGAVTGSYDIAVAQLAQVQKTVSAGLASQSEALLGTGTLTLGGETIAVDAANNSLQGLAAAINERAADTGVQASIIHDGDSTAPYRLVLTGADAQGSFTPVVDLVDAEGQAVELGLVEVRAAQQAVAYVDGIKVVSNSNTLRAVPGVTVQLTELSATTHPGTSEEGVEPAQWADPPQYKNHLLSVEADTEALKEKIQTFVDSYNGVMDWISSGYVEFGAPVATLKEDGEGAEESLAVLLRGDATINSAKRSLQNILSTAVSNSGAFSVMSQLGITTRRDGSLELDAVMLDKELAQNFDDVGKLLSGDEQTAGVMKSFNAELLKMTSATSGLYAAKEERHDAAVKRIDTQILNTEFLLEKKEANLRKRFAAMELLVSGMNAQSSFLTQQMNMLSNMTTGDK